jgi:hypothetical protein
VAVFVGLIAAPAIGGSLGTVLQFSFQALATGQLSYLSQSGSFLSAGLLAGLILGIPSSFTLGLLVHTLLVRRGLVRVWHYAFFGMLIAMTTAFSLALVIGSWTTFGATAIFFGLCGAIGGLTFWLIRRPDRDRKTTS